MTKTLGFIRKASTRSYFSVAPEEELQKFDRLMGFLMYVSDN
jgi:hypothetical protein